MSVHFSSVKLDWRTPVGVFEELHAEFGFTVDGCSTDENALLPHHWTEQDEPLLRSWAGERVFINPPYGRQIARWMEKAWTEQNSAEVIVALVPSRTDTGWWHDYVMGAAEIRFGKGRLTFVGDSKNPAPFPSAVIVWRPTTNRGDLKAAFETAELEAARYGYDAAYSVLRSAVETLVGELRVRP